MATVPHRLHNFSLPSLKWGHKNQINVNNKFRKSAESAEAEDDASEIKSQTAQNRFSFTCSSHYQEPMVVEGVTYDNRDQKIYDADESLEKPWNLRPRKVVSKIGFEIGTFSKKGVNSGMSAAAATAIPMAQTEIHPKSTRLRGVTKSHVAERRGKRKLWLALSREEVEEDVYAMTGLRPTRRPKKRSKNVQKHVDNVFPGSYLVGVSADDYRVYESLR